MSKPEAAPKGAAVPLSPAEERPPGLVAWYTTALLAFLYWLSILDRFIISLLVDPIKQDLGITDVQFGMLHGMAFAVTFSLFGLMAGTYADRYSRRLIIYVSVSIWSLGTAACGMAHNFWHMLLARVGVGAGEAGLNPAASSMITDLFPPSKLTLALAIYAIGGSVGAGCAYLFGGILVDMVSGMESVNLPLIGDVRPWQSVFYIIGIPGVLIAFLSFTMPEPKRRGVQNQATATGLVNNYKNLVAFMAKRKSFFSHHYLGFGLASLLYTGLGAWYPAHMSRSFGWDASQIGLTLGLTLVIAGAIGKLLCGFGVDVLYRKGYRDAQFRWYGICMLVAMPLGVIATTSDNPWVFLGGLGIFLILLSPITAVYVSSLNLVTPNELRGSGVAFYSAVVGLITLSLGPVSIAAISDYGFGGDAIGMGMAVMIGISCPLGAFVLLRGRKAMHQAVVDAESLT